MLDAAGCAVRAELAVVRATAALGSGTLVTVVLATGADVGAVYMPAPQSGSPMTYMLDGRQYIVLAISGGAYSGEYVAFALPS